MRLSELKSRLLTIRDEGFVQTRRKGPTGIGYTLESLLELTENNLPIPDIGGRVEVKATRSNTNNLITLFTFNRGVWVHRPKEIVSRWGYWDAEKGRQALYTTVSAQEPNRLGLQLSISNDATSLSLNHVPSSSLLATWDMYYIVGKFVSKFSRMLFVHADTRRGDGLEEFYYTRANLLSEPSSLTFRDGFNSGIVTIDVRMYLKPNGQVRNHGTGFRVQEHSLPDLFDKSISIL
ncbi:MAG: hypothetical protein F4Y50_07705 [Dehalococcoidia bacterium]|nr:hypothetical protein [Dehalococcoidia bacterium]MYD50737.1 hypothetical protein [Dehalococcoidia bacterium]